MTRMLKDNGYLSGSQYVADQLNPAQFAAFNENKLQYKFYYKSWNRDRLIKEIMKL